MKQRAEQVLHKVMRRMAYQEVGLASMDTERMKRVILAVDDTDDATKATSTGEIAGLIADEVPSLGGRVVLGVTRHQLLIADDVPYTSHNSAMAFEAYLPEGAAEELRARAISIIADNRAESSDPGLAVAELPDLWSEEELTQLTSLATFGYRAKREFCSISEAYELAKSVSWLELSEHGGKGCGVVGALAGVGLRLDGNDGRFRGKWNLRRICGFDGMQQVAVGEVVTCLAGGLHGGVQVLDLYGDLMDDKVPFSLGQDVKPLLKDGKLSIVCEHSNGVAYPCKKADLGEMGNVCGSWRQVCEGFEWDNDPEECIDTQPACKNCLYRRWVPRGFKCVLPEMQTKAQIKCG